MFETLCHVYICLSLILISPSQALAFCPIFSTNIQYPFYIVPLYFCSLLLVPVSDLRTVSSILVPGTFIQELKMTEPLEAWDLAMETPLGWLVLFPSIYFMLTFSQMWDAGVTAKDTTDLLLSLLEPELISSWGDRHLTNHTVHHGVITMIRAIRKNTRWYSV